MWDHERVFCNPPYSRGNVEAFFIHAMHQTRIAEAACSLAVLILPTYTERDWFHKYRNQFEVRFIRRRVQFIGGGSSARGNHMIVIFRGIDWAWWSP